MPLVVRLDAQLESGLRALSAEEGQPQAAIVRDLIRTRLRDRRQKKSAYQLAVELGVIGMDPDPRTDVAERHSHYLRKTLSARRGRRTG